MLANHKSRHCKGCMIILAVLGMNVADIGLGV